MVCDVCGGKLFPKSMRVDPAHRIGKTFGIRLKVCTVSICKSFYIICKSWKRGAKRRS